MNSGLRAKRRRALIANLGMLTGVLAWLAGELFGVYNNQTAGTDTNDTTTQWCRAFVRPHRLIGVGLFFGGVAVLATHFFWP